MPKSVLISGCSSGIGYSLALELARQGYQVFAGVRNIADADRLHSQASTQLTPVILDITQPEKILSACQQVSEKTGGELYCLVNNAGINISGAMEFMPIQDFRQQIEVNVTGQLALTQACLAMIRSSTGRIIFISSIAARLVTNFNGPYAASKAALIALADALRLELAPWNIPVSVMIVGSVQTQIWEKSASKAGEIVRRLPPEAWKLYGKTQKRAGLYYQQAGRTGMPVQKATQAIYRQITKTHPKPYVWVGYDALMYELAFKLLPIRLRDWLVRKQMGLLNF
jgi:NAD(P)-dependent dehydrogenase (short-subunit alcohol dehydrogenase family)